MSANPSREPSVDELRRDAEVTRAHLTGTVEELRSQLSDTADHVREAVAPATIKRQVTEYVRESGDNLLHSLQRRVRENPLQAVAVGAGLAYPLFNLMRAIPAPLLLIGAGLALSRSTAVREATDQAITQARDTFAEASDSARNTLHDMRDAAGSMLDRGSEFVSSMTDGIANTAREATASIKGSADASLDRGGASLNAAGDKISNLASQTKQTLNSAYDQNPLLIAGIGLAVGALIASSLPSTQVENRVFGDTSEKLRQRAADAAEQGLDSAKELVNNVVDAAAQEGLSGQGLSTAAGDITQKARAVVERGVKAALGDQTPNKTL
jgi:ElaB/YqjD/DUF883 family membrane-anchored ribosome-binding protein